MGSNNLDIGAVLRDPDFLGLSTVEKRKFLMDADPDFRSLPVAEQSKFIVSMTSPLFEPRPSSPALAREAVLGFTGTFLPETETPLTDVAKAAKPDLTSGWTYVDPTGIGRTAYGAAAAAVRGAREILPVLPKLTPGGGMGRTITPEEAETAVHGLGTIAGIGTQSALLKRQAGERVPKPKAPEPVVINEQLGQAMQSYLDKANVAIGKEIGKHVDNIVAAVDDPVRNPIPPIDAKSKIQTLKEGFEAYDSTVKSMNLEPSTVIKKTVEEAIQSPRWTWNQAKDVRTALMDMQRKAGTRMSGAVGKAIGELTNELRSTAKAAGVEADFNSYNTLARQRGYIQEQFLDNVLNASSGTDVMSALTGTKEGPVKINLPALKAYGVDPTVVSDAIAFSKRLKSAKEGKWYQGWGARSIGAHAAMALGIPYSAGWFGIEALQALKGRGKAPVGESGTALVEGERIAKGRMPIPPSEVATPTEVPAMPYPPTGVAGETRQRLLPPVPKVRAAAPEAAPEIPSAPSEILPKPTAFQREIAKRDALLDLRKNLRTPSAQGKAWLESKGVDFEKPGALAEAHRVINEELARLTGKGKKAGAKKEPLPPIPKKKGSTQ